MSESRADMLQGTLELLVLKILSIEPMHGWGISQRIAQGSRNVLQVNQGSLYPALERMGRKGWIRSSWRTTESNRRARFYELTADGVARLAEERTAWERSAAAVNWILTWTGGSPIPEAGV